MQHTTNTLYGLQLLRYIAAIMVVAYHAEKSLIERGVIYPYHLFSIGSIGVDIFFVISGFIISLSVANLSEKNTRLHNSIDFFVRRLIRIAPLYWFYTSLKIILVLIVPALALRSSLDVKHLISSYLFIPYLAPWGLWQPILPVGWTLNYEIYFYIAFTIAILIGKYRLATMLTLFISVFLLSKTFEESNILSFYSNDMLLEFIFGYLLFLIHKKAKLSQKISVYTIPSFFVSVLLISISSEEYRLFTVGIGSSLLVFSFIYLDKFIPTLSTLKKIEILGDSSYSLYLSHGFTLPICAIICYKLNINGLEAMTMSLLISTIVGIISFKLLEQPITYRLNQQWKIYHK
jgi:peptidoglycan/LPS O-acetylase OafA/YrhL